MDQETATVPADRLDGVRALVVDDDADARDLFASILTQAGALVETASSTAEAMRVLGQQPVDVIVSDIEMPDADGYQFLQSIGGGRSRPDFNATSPNRSSLPNSSRPLPRW